MRHTHIDTLRLLAHHPLARRNEVMGRMWFLAAVKAEMGYTNTPSLSGYLHERYRMEVWLAEAESDIEV